MTVASVAWQDLIVELLSDIFLECLPEDGLARMQQNEAPLNVSHVCRHWRFVSCSTHRLWTGLSVRCAPDETISKYALPTLQAFLQRSGSADFHLKIHCTKDDVDAHSFFDRWPPIEVLFHELTDEKERIKSLTLAVPQARSQDALELTINTLPALDHLSLHFLKDNSYPWLSLDKRFWMAASRLVSLEFDSPSNFMYVLEDIEISTLKHVAFNAFTYTALLHILDSCPTLESLYFSPVEDSAFVLIGSDGLAMGAPKQRHYPSIQVLEVPADARKDTSMLREFFKFARFPNLRRLIVPMSDFMGSDFPTHLAASHPPLEELYLINDEPSYDEESLIRTLKSLPKLKKLRIQLHQAVMEALIWFDVGIRGKTCPLLEEVTLDIKEMTFAESVQTWIDTEDMIRSRWEVPINCLSAAAKSRTSISTHSIAAPKNLRKINFPAIKEEHWKKHPFYRRIKDCLDEGLIVGFHDNVGNMRSGSRDI